MPNSRPLKQPTSSSQRREILSILPLHSSSSQCFARRLYTPHPSSTSPPQQEKQDLIQNQSRTIRKLSRLYLWLHLAVKWSSNNLSPPIPNIHPRSRPWTIGSTRSSPSRASASHTGNKWRSCVLGLWFHWHRSPVLPLDLDRQFPLSSVRGGKRGAIYEIHFI